MTEQDARAALRAQDIPNPSKDLIDSWLRVQEYEEAGNPCTPEETQELDTRPENLSPVEAEHPHSSRESRLEPMLRERGQLERPAGRRKPGRPRVLAPWFQAVARAMADGTPLRQALSICGIYGLTPKQLRSLYRNRTFQTLYREARRKWLPELGFHHTKRTRRPKACRGADCLGFSRKLLRVL